VGHELRNPLGAIKNAVYYIRGKLTRSEVAEKEPRVLEFLDIVDGEVNSSNKIINDLLGFSRIGKPSVSPTTIKKMVDDALARVPVPKNIELDEHMGGDSTEIEVDAGQIQQVLVNVITNAVQAMPEGGKLTISTRKREGFLELDIADTGSGIADEVRGKIFDPLFTTRAKGIGLGLAVSKSIIERHGGKIEAKSEAGKGTTFTISLPLETPAQEDSFGRQ
jgi:signal transduction histidine kinase